MHEHQPKEDTKTNAQLANTHVDKLARVYVRIIKICVHKTRTFEFIYAITTYMNYIKLKVVQNTNLLI
jgi:hypothetical protein